MKIKNLSKWTEDDLQMKIKNQTVGLMMIIIQKDKK